MQCFYKKINNTKTLSVSCEASFGEELYPWLTQRRSKSKNVRALQYGRRGSFTVEAAFVVPIFVFAAVMIMNLFLLMMAEIQITGAMQYAARKMAVICQDEDQGGSSILTAAGGLVYLRTYISENSDDLSMVNGGVNGISLLLSEFDERYITLRASYQVKIPITFWRLQNLPVQQCVRVKMWNGAEADGGGEEGEENGYVYITPEGNAYHKSTSCRYLDLSIQSVSLSQIDRLRNKDKGKYYPCSCYSGGSQVYITDYGTEYHSSLGCSSLKRTVTRVKESEAGGRHACSKCCR